MARALEILQDEISLAMAMLGVASLGDLDRSNLRHDTVPRLGRGACLRPGDEKA